MQSHFVVIDETTGDILGPNDLKTQGEAEAWLKENQAPGSGEYSIYQRIKIYKIVEETKLIEVTEEA